MPEHITVEDFLRETWDDYNSPTTSNFVSRMGDCKQTLGALEESLDSERSGLNKMKKSVKALHSTGNTQVNNELYMAENMERLGHYSTKDGQTQIGAAFLKFAVVTKELSGLLKNLMQNMNNIMLFPIDSFLKGDFKGVKGDMKKPFDKAWKEYDTKFNKIEKEKKQIAKEAGFIKTEVTGAEIAEEMEKERRVFQLQACEYLIKVNDIKTKKGVDLLQHLVEYYQAQNNYFQDGLKTIEHFRAYIEELVTQLSVIRLQNDNEKRQLVELRESLKNALQAYKEVPAPSSGNTYNLHQLQGNKSHGCEKNGFLLKKSDGKMRKVWQRRRCAIQEGVLLISHSDTSKEPVRLNLLTCQVKLIPEDPGKKCFDLISSSQNRTYHFQGEDTRDMEEWISVLNNAKETVLMKAFGEASGPGGSHINQNIKELTRTIIQEVRRLPGNRICCDCGAPDPEWLSVNLGVLICLECCGVHRQMGVHISRTQSIVIDDLGTSQLLMARVVSNRGFNDIMEATLDMKHKPTPSSDMEERKLFIRAKYEKRRFAIVTCTNVDDRRQELKQAVMQRDIYSLLQVYAEGVDFMEPLPDMEDGESAVHLAIKQEDGTSLFMVDFMLQNTNSQHLSRGDSAGNTPLHACASLNLTECMKLLLRLLPELVNFENQQGLTPLEVAKDLHHETCVELLNNAIAGRTDFFANVNVDWDLIQDDHLYDTVDCSDDDLDGSNTPEQRKPRSRPGSLILMGSEQPPNPPGLAYRERSLTADSLKCPPIAPPLSAPPHKAKFGPMTQPSQVMVPGSNSTLQKKKAPAPPPPSSHLHAPGHTRNTSDPGLIPRSNHQRMNSDPPPLPTKMNPPGSRTLPPGGKLVLPPPPEFREPDVAGGIPPMPTVPAPSLNASQTHGSTTELALKTPDVHHVSSPTDSWAELNLEAGDLFGESSSDSASSSIMFNRSVKESPREKRRLSLPSNLPFLRKKKLLVCSQCKEMCWSKEALAEHKKSHIVQKSVECKNCRKTFPGQKFLEKHQCIAKDKRYSCDKCSKVFLSEAQLRLHLKTHLKLVEHTCKQCKKRLTSQENLEKHVQLFHNTATEMKCEFCNKVLASQVKLGEHLQSVHGRPPSGKTAQKKGSFRTSHLQSRLHTAASQTHVCPHCLRSFRHRQILSDHLNTHSDHRPFHCPKCSASGARSSVRSRAQNESKVFKCSHCSESFNLKRHMVVHVRRFHRTASSTSLNASSCPNTSTSSISQLQNVTDPKDKESVYLRSTTV